MYLLKESLKRTKSIAGKIAAIIVAVVSLENRVVIIFSFVNSENDFKDLSGYLAFLSVKSEI